MQIKTLVVSPFEVNCYLVWDQARGKCAIIDPGDEDELIIDTIRSNNLTPEAILLTHGHGDHIGAVDPLIKKYDIPLYVGEGEDGLLANPSAEVSAFFGYQIVCPPPDKLLKDKDVIRIGGVDFTVFSTPGHSPGGVCYFAGNSVFCGDTLFYGSIGRTDLAGGSYKVLIDSIEQKLLTLPDDIICYPGHGPSTTIGQERRSNPFLTGNRFV